MSKMEFPETQTAFNYFASRLPIISDTISKFGYTEASFHAILNFIALDLIPENEHLDYARAQILLYNMNEILIIQIRAINKYMDDNAEICLQEIYNKKK